MNASRTAPRREWPVRPSPTVQPRHIRRGELRHVSAPVDDLLWRLYLEGSPYNGHERRARPNARVAAAGTGRDEV